MFLSKQQLLRMQCCNKTDIEVQPVLLLEGNPQTAGGYIAYNAHLTPYEVTVIVCRLFITTGSYRR